MQKEEEPSLPEEPHRRGPGEGEGVSGVPPGIQGEQGLFNRDVASVRCTSLVSSSRIDAWLEGREPIPPDLQQRISAWLQNPTRESAPLPQETVDAWFQSLEPVPREDQALVESLLSKAVKHVLNRPLRTTSRLTSTPESTPDTAQHSEPSSHSTPPSVQ